MGLLDNLFKPKPDQPEEIAETAERNAEPASAPVAPAVPDAGAQTAPAAGALLPSRQTPFLASTPVLSAGAAPVPVERPSLIPPEQSTPERGIGEITIPLGDVLARIPTNCLLPGMHDAQRELRFRIDDLSADIARGRAAVPLSRLAAQFPDVFRADLSPEEDISVRLPLQKLVEQIGRAGRRPTPAAAPEPQKGVAPAPETPPAAEASMPGEPRIQLSAAAVLKNCPRELFTGEPPTLPAELRVSLPFPPIERQLGSGKVEVSALRFIGALPAEYMRYFQARDGITMTLPLEEIIQNLPSRVEDPAEQSSADVVPQGKEPPAAASAPTVREEEVAAPPLDAPHVSAPPPEPAPVSLPQDLQAERPAVKEEPVSRAEPAANAAPEPAPAPSQPGTPSPAEDAPPPTPLRVEMPAPILAPPVPDPSVEPSPAPPAPVQEVPISPTRPGPPPMRIMPPPIVLRATAPVSVAETLSRSASDTATPAPAPAAENIALRPPSLPIHPPTPHVPHEAVGTDSAPGAEGSKPSARAVEQPATALITPPLANPQSYAPQPPGSQGGQQPTTLAPATAPVEVADVPAPPQRFAPLQLRPVMLQPPTILAPVLAPSVSTGQTLAQNTSVAAAQAVASPVHLTPTSPSFGPPKSQSASPASPVLEPASTEPQQGEELQSTDDYESPAELEPAKPSKGLAATSKAAPPDALEVRAAPAERSEEPPSLFLNADAPPVLPAPSVEIAPPDEKPPERHISNEAMAAAAPPAASSVEELDPPAEEPTPKLEPPSPEPLAQNLRGSSRLQSTAESLLKLPGVAGCVLFIGDELAVAGSLPHGQNAAALRNSALNWTADAPFAGLGAGVHSAVHAPQQSLHFFTRDGAGVCAFLRTRVFLPGVREQLQAAAELLATSRES